MEEILHQLDTYPFSHNPWVQWKITIYKWKETTFWRDTNISYPTILTTGWKPGIPIRNGAINLQSQEDSPEFFKVSGEI